MIENLTPFNRVSHVKMKENVAQAGLFRKIEKRCIDKSIEIVSIVNDDG